MTRENKDNCIIIAEFMGAKIIQKENDRIVCDFPNKSGHDWWLDYDTKWDWLMPVLLKIEEQGCVVELNIGLSKMVRIYDIETRKNFINEEINLINAAYKSVLEYIEFYNLKISKMTKVTTSKGLIEEYNSIKSKSVNFGAWLSKNMVRYKFNRCDVDLYVFPNDTNIAYTMPELFEMYEDEVHKHLVHK